MTSKSNNVCGAYLRAGRVTNTPSVTGHMIGSMFVVRIWKTTCSHNRTYEWLSHNSLKHKKFVRVSLSAWTAITSYHRLGGPNNTYLPLTILGAGKGKVKVPTGQVPGPVGEQPQAFTMRAPPSWPSNLDHLPIPSSHCWWWIFSAFVCLINVLYSLKKEVVYMQFFPQSHLWRMFSQDIVRGNNSISPAPPSTLKF